MRRFQCALLTAVAVIGFASIASAADMPAKAPAYKAPVMAPAYNWSGFYLGIQGGAAWGRSQVISADPIDNPGLPITDPFNISGGLFGGTIGYNWQFNSWVFGVEGDLSWVSKKGTVNDILPFTTSWTNTTNEKWLGTGRVRVGFTPVDRWLVYATGGFAVADVESVVNTQTLGVFSETQTRWGWTAGGGVEAALYQNWSVKLEYLYVSLPDKDYFAPDIPIGTSGFTVLTRTVHLNNNIVRAGVNYKF